MKQKVFVLGAGASKPSGVPLMSELLEEALWKPYVNSVFGTSSNEIGDCDAVVDFLEKQFDQPLRPRQEGIYLSDSSLLCFCASHNAEELLTMIEAVSDPTGRADVFRAFTRLLFRALQPFGLNQKNNCYPNFSVQVEKSLREASVTIISFNYDTLLERALLDLNRNLASSFSYLVPFHDRRHWNPYSESYIGNFELLKLHGSFNWATCRGCGSFTLCWFQLFDNIGKTTCQKCGAVLLPLLVAPAASKHVQGVPWSSLWERAVQCLSSCEELTIIGYSLRDLQARDLFKDAMVSNPTVERITVVDRNVENLLAEFRELIGNPSTVKFDAFDSFEKYCGLNS